MKTFCCDGCGLTELDVSKNPKLYQLHCSDNQLTELDLSQNPLIQHLYCANNQLTTLDISNCPQLLEWLEKAKLTEKNGVRQWDILKSPADNIWYNQLVLRIDMDVELIKKPRNSRLHMILPDTHPAHERMQSKYPEKLSA